MNRVDFQRLADERLSDAGSLLKAGRHGCAYYIAGYAIECALKACIARMTQQDEFPPRDAVKYYVHDLPKLLHGAGLELEFEEEAAKDAAFSANWNVVKDWSEGARYEGHEQREAENLLAAIGDARHGVLQWLKRNW
jgi:HEPN domain-containing protein